MDYFAEFCNVCRNKNTDSYVNIRKNENRQLLEILMSFLGSADIIQNVDVYLCLSCCKQLRNYKEFREMCVENLIKTREAYFKLKSKLKSEMDATTGKDLAFLIVENVFESDIENKNDLVHDLVDPLMIKKEEEDEPADVSAGEALGESGVGEQMCVLPADHWATKLHEEKDLDNSGDELEDTDWQDGHMSADTTVERSSNCIDDSLTKDNCSQGGPAGAVEEQQRNEKSARLGQKPVHGREKPFKCEVCARTFVNKFNLLTHKRVHSGEKPYKCEVCGRAFTKNSSLLTHKRLHSGEKPYKCEVCARTFTDNSSLFKHRRVHTGERPYKCEVCARGFTSKSNLDTHMRIHSGEKPFKCEVCALTFTEKSNMQKHSRVHTGERRYKCEVCPRTFLKNSNLLRHKLVHSGERPHKCEVCARAFADKFDLARHARLHTGEKPHQCQVCAHSFYRKSDLLKHERVHSG